MSIENVKELFAQRVEESINLQCNDYCTDNKLNSLGGCENLECASLKEIDAGITEYLSDCKGFSAVIKQRFSDFHVHEIDTEGNIAYLTNSEVPVTKTESVDYTTISDELWTRLECLKNGEIETVEIDVTSFDKEKRKQIHKAIKRKYGSNLFSNTKDVNDRKILTVSRKSNKRSNEWPSEVGQYLHFILFKKNCDTAFAINTIASQLRTKSSNFTYAGTKDKRANTTQWVSMWHLDAKRLNGINKSLQGLKVGNYIYKNFPLKLGDLKGNHFEIALRNVCETDESLNKTLSVVKDNGFINYFGLQRFGNSVEIPTYEIGKALLQGDFKKAVELILKPRKGRMKNDLREARRIWWETRDSNMALQCLKSKNQIEGQLLSGLAKHGKNAYVNALDCIPRNVRLLYLHAYQSFIWNKVLSKRIKTYGKHVLEGDLVLVDKNQKINNDIDLSKNEHNNMVDQVHCLSKDELENFKITDILHPLPGYRIIYPNNIIKDWYEEFLKDDGLTSESMKQTVKKYSLSGTYRHVVKRIRNMTWNICSYSNQEEDLILSDLDKLEGKVLDVNKNNDSKYKAVILSFSLDSSTYATMALREILKIDTSCSYQATLNSYSNKRSLDDDEIINKKSKTDL